jgi:hypothetical protein
MSKKKICLRTAAAHHRALEARDISTKSLLFVSTEVPFIFEWVESHVHNSPENLSVSFAFDPFNHLVQYPGPREKLSMISKAC